MTAKWNDMPCTSCRKQISVDATRCPYCQTDFSPEQVAARQSQQKKALAAGCGGLVLIVAIIMALSQCSGEPTVNDKPPELAAIEQPIILPCDEGDKLCPGDVDQARRDWPKALTGDYQAQRNIAFGFSTGHRVVQSPVQGCAWRIVILAMADAQVDSSDTSNYKFECGRLNAESLDQACATAVLITRRIAGRDLVTPSGLGARDQ